MPKCSDIINAINKIAPPEAAYSWDNPGLMTGDENAEITKVLIALDCESSVIEEAVSLGANMIVTHHPLIFRPVKSVTTGSRTGSLLIKLIKNNINLFSAHTNLDSSPIGTNATLASLLELENIQPLLPPHYENYSMGRTGSLKTKMTTEAFAEFVKSKLSLRYMSVAKAASHVSKIGICTGHGCDEEFLTAAAACGCDGYISGDVGYHEAQTALFLGISLFDGTHYATETIVSESVAKHLKSLFPNTEIIISKVNCQTLNII